METHSINDCGYYTIDYNIMTWKYFTASMPWVIHPYLNIITASMPWDSSLLELC